MKKVIYILSLLFVLALSACINIESSDKKDVGLEKDVTVLVPNGTPYYAIAGLLEYKNISIDAVSGPSNLQAALTSGSHDIVIAPINLGVNLYNKGNLKYKVSHILTSNNAYIVTKSENKLDSINDLASQKVIAFGETGIPANVLKTVYKKNDLDINDIDFQYTSSANVYSVFAGNSTDAKYALMSEPEISKLVVKDGISINTLDLSEVLGVDIAQACIYVNSEKITDKDINKVLEIVASNVLSLNNNVESYVNRIIKLDRIFEATGKDVLIRSLPLTNIIFKEAKTNKLDIESILNILGVELPDEEFYC